MDEANEDLIASWKRTHVLLERAFALVPSPHDGKNLFGGFLDHNELALALDDLAALAGQMDVNSEFWDLLQRAALEMAMDDHATQFEKNASGARKDQ